MCVTSEATVVAKWWKSEMNHKISVYYNVDWRVVIHPFLALIVKCRYGLFAPKFCTNTILNSWVTTCQGIDSWFDSCSCWLQAIREDCLNHKPFSISAIFFGHSSWDFFNFLHLHPASSLTHRLFSIASFQDLNQEPWSFVAKTLKESFMVTCYNWLFTLWWTWVP